MSRAIREGNGEFGIVGGTFTIEVPDQVSREEARFNRTNLSKRDLREARNYLAEFSGTGSVTARRALLTAAVVAYARPFKTSYGGQTGRATKRLEIDFKSLLTPEEQALHARVINLRDHAIAHSNYDLKPTGRMNGRNAPYSSGFMTWAMPFEILVLEADIAALIALIDRLERHCADELFRLNKELSARESKGK